MGVPGCILAVPAAAACVCCALTSSTASYSSLRITRDPLSAKALAYGIAAAEESRCTPVAVQLLVLGQPTYERAVAPPSCPVAAKP